MRGAALLFPNKMLASSLPSLFPAEVMHIFILCMGKLSGDALPVVHRKCWAIILSYLAGIDGGFLGFSYL